MTENKNFKLPRGGEVSLSVNSGYVYIKCIAPKELYSNETRLYVKSFSGENLAVGKMSERNGELCLEKSYSMSYFASNRIYIDDICGFDTEPEETEEFLQADGFEGECIYNRKNDYEDDSAYNRASGVLNSIKPNRDYSAEAKFARDSISCELKKHKQISFEFSKNYIWYEIDEIYQSFNLTSVEHIIFSEFFVRAYAKSGKWFFGVSSDEGMYAVCAFCPRGMPNPMENALDCFVSFEDKSLNGEYFVVGVGVFDDGQFFYRICE